jgi:hypothetical protein
MSARRLAAGSPTSVAPSGRHFGDPSSKKRKKAIPQTDVEATKTCQTLTPIPVSREERRAPSSDSTLLGPPPVFLSECVKCGDRHCGAATEYAREAMRRGCEEQPLGVSSLHSSCSRMALETIDRALCLRLKGRHCPLYVDTFTACARFLKLKLHVGFCPDLDVELAPYRRLNPYAMWPCDAGT